MPEGFAIREQLDALRIDRDATDTRGSGLRVWIVAAMLVALVAVAGGAWWWGRGESTTPVTTARVEQRLSAPLGTTVLDASGYVTARRRAAVSVKVTGKLVELLVEEGMPVQAGQVLGRLDDSGPRAALALADSQLDAARGAVEETRARLELAELTLGRTRRLFADNVLGQADLDEASTERRSFEARLERQQQEVVVAEREVALRRTELDDTVIRAPFDGVVISKNAQPGETVSLMSAGSGATRGSLCTLVDMSSLEIEVDVNEAYISRVRPDQPVEAVLDAYPDWKIPAHVITTIPAADRQKATVEVRIGFDELDPRILPDMGVKVSFRERRDEGDDSDTETPRLVVSSSAIRRIDGRQVVFVQQGDHVERRAIRAEINGEEAIVLSGLSAGEHVVVEGADGLIDGARVESR